MQRLIWSRPRLTVVVFVGLIVLGALALRLTESNLATAQTQTLSALQADADPGLDPNGAIWRAVDETEVPLTAQNLVYPQGGRVPTVRTQAVHFDDTLYVRLEWDDPSANDATFAAEQFADAVALEFPADSASSVPSVCMGQADSGVNIWHWRADSAAGFLEDPATARAGTLVDHYPTFADADLNYPARAVGNPMAQPNAGAVQSLAAQAFGTLSPTDDQAVTGSGIHEAAGWAVVLARPFAGATADHASFEIGTTTDIAVAVWDGENGDRDGQKAVSQFMRLSIERETVRTPAVAVTDGGDTNWALVLGIAVGIPVLIIIAVFGYARVRGERAI